MNTIRKFTLDPVDRQTIDMPLLAEIISIAFQRDEIVLYAIVDTEITDIRPRTIDRIGTNAPYSEKDMRTIG